MATIPVKTGNGQIAKPDAIRTIQDLLARSKSQIQAALPKHLDADRLARISLTTIRQTPKLLECDPLSLVKCIMQAAALGLEPDPLLGRAYLVPYGREVQLIIGYRGLIDLARRSGEIQSIEAHVVYEADEWDYAYGLEPRLFHRPADTEKRGKVVAAWALARFKDGGYQFEVMNLSELEAVRRSSRAGNNGTWVSHTAEMYRKTVLRRLGKLLPLSPTLSSHLAKEEAIESGAAFSDDGELVEMQQETPSSESEKLLSKMAEGKPEPPEPRSDG